MNSDSPKYFDLHVSGIGHLRRIRDVTPRGSKQSYTCCDLVAFHGPADDVRRLRIDCKVMDSARAAFDVIRQAVEAAPRVLVNGDSLPPQVLVGFKASDLTVETFTYSKGPRQGETGVSVKGRLLRIEWAKLGDTSLELPAEANAVPQTRDEMTEAPDSAEPSAVLRIPAEFQAPDSLDEIALDREAPDFEVRRQELKAAGYRFDSARKVWVRPALHAVAA